MSRILSKIGNNCQKHLVHQKSKIFNCAKKCFGFLTFQGGGCKMKILKQIENNFGGRYKMRIEKMIVFLVLFAVFSAAAFAATVTHPAENIRAGIFGNIYVGNWSFMNGSVGIGTTNTSQKLMVKASAQHDGVYLQNTIGDIVGKM